MLLKSTVIISTVVLQSIRTHMHTILQLIVELADIDSCPQMLETNHRVPIK